MERHWADERTPRDCPGYDMMKTFPVPSLAEAWADGWNAAVAECTRQLDEAARREGLDA